MALLPCASTRWPDQSTLQCARSLNADVLLWHVGRTSFLVPPVVPDWQREAPPIVGIWTSPIYQLGELRRLGCGALFRAPCLSSPHLLGLLVRGRVVCEALQTGWLSGLAVECEHTSARLIALGIAKHRVHVLRPVIDPSWFQIRLDPRERRTVRRQMGVKDEDLLVGTFGPSEPLRGLPDLLSALAIARAERPGLRLLAFCRPQHDGKVDSGALAQRVARVGGEEWAQLVGGWIEPTTLARNLAACDLIALPFRLVPSDVPLSVLEAMALGRPLVVTDVSCLPELVPRGTGLVVPPAAPRALAEAILLLSRGRGLREHLGAAARTRAVWWQAESGVAKWEQLLEQVAEHASSTWQAQTGRARAPRRVY
jgi:glycosyltransferase involved in cell wall biosynthesis